MSKLNNSIQRVLLVGFGSIGKRYLRILSKHYSDVEVAVLRHSRCDENQDRTQPISCFTKLADAIQFKPQVAFICNPASMHIDIATQLAQQGVHLFIEKPLSSELANVNALIDMCVQRKLKLATAYNLRFLKTLLLFKETIDANKLGQLLSVRAEVGQYLPSWRTNTDYRKSVSALQALGGGVLLELSHEIDYLIWLFGKVRWLSSHIATTSNLEIDVEDSAFITMGFESKSSSQDLIVSLNMDFVRQDTTRKCSVIGENGTLCWDGIAGTVQLYSKDAEGWEQLLSDKPDADYTYHQEIKNFFNAIHHDEQPFVSGYDGLQVLTIIDVIRKSSEAKQTIYIDS